MSQKKRKRVSDHESHSPTKKPATDRHSTSIRVSLVDEARWKPVLASTPGLSLPENAAITPYSNPRAKSRNLLLHSDSHPKLDYTAQEEAPGGPDQYLKHYVGIYDPRRNKVKLVPATSMVMQSTLKTARKPAIPDSSDSEDQAMGTRNALGLAFGTKKSQKAIRSLTTNAITPSQGGRQNNPTNNNSSSSPPPLDPLASAVLSTMPATTTAATTSAQAAAELDAAKPRPKPNLLATSPQDVYDPNILAGGADVLAKLKVKDWIDAVKAGRDVPLPSLYVAKRIPAVVGTGKDVPKLRLLKYVFLLLRWYKVLKPPQGKKRGKMVPKLESSPDLAPLVAEFGSEVLAGLKRRFADEGGELNKWHVDNLVTHILACMLIIDGFEVDTHNAAYDLGLEQGVLANYFKELGCSVGKMGKKECEERGLSRAEGSTRRLARLRLPLVFPKLRRRGR